MLKKPYLILAVFSIVSSTAFADFATECLSFHRSPPCDGAPGKCIQNGLEPGGFVADTVTLIQRQQRGPFIGLEAEVCDSAVLDPEVQILDQARVSGRAEIRKRAKVGGQARVLGDAIIDDFAAIEGQAKVYGQAVIKGNTIVSGDAEMTGKISVEGGLFSKGLVRTQEVVTLLQDPSWFPAVLTSVIQERHLEALNDINEAKLDLRRPLDRGWTPFVMASSVGFLDGLKFLWDRQKAFLPVEEVWLAFTKAIENFRPETIEWLLTEIERTPDLRESSEKDKALILAASYGYPTVLDRLIAMGARIEATNAAGQTALLVAAQKGNADCVLRLLVAGAHPNHIDLLENNALHWAVKNEHSFIAKMLLHSGTNPEHKNLQHESVLSLASTSKDRGFYPTLKRYLNLDCSKRARLTPSNALQSHAARLFDKVLRVNLGVEGTEEARYSPLIEVYREMRAIVDLYERGQLAKLFARSDYIRAGTKIFGLRTAFPLQLIRSPEGQQNLIIHFKSFRNARSEKVRMSSKFSGGFKVGFYSWNYDQGKFHVRLGLREGLKYRPESQAELKSEYEIQKHFQDLPGVMPAGTFIQYKGSKGINKSILVQNYMVKEAFVFVINSTPEERKEAFFKVFLPVTRALANLHQQGYVHGDVKLENIYFDYKSGYLADFGFARHISQPGTIALGTLGYLPPDYLKFMLASNETKRRDPLSWSATVMKANQDQKVDVFGLGVSLYSYVFNANPFPGKRLETNAEVAWKMSRVESLSDLEQQFGLKCQSIQHPLQDLICKMIDPVSERRPSSAEVLTRLEKLQDQAELEGLTFPAYFGMTLRKHRP